MTKIDWLVLDLGNVLLEVNQGHTVAAFSRVTGLDPETVVERLGADTTFWARCGTEEFSIECICRETSEALGTDLPRSAIIECLNAELGPAIPATARKLEALRGSVRTACLSNTNGVHWRRLHDSYTFMPLFEHRLASQELGFAKPDIRIYRAASSALGAAPERILFFDDRVENVDGAREAGWNARVFTTYEQFASDLAEFGL